MKLKIKPSIDISKTTAIFFNKDRAEKLREELGKDWIIKEITIDDFDTWYAVIEGED